ncbi:MAG: hypothetical protein PVG66_10755 [Chromatiales bacterium]|jgi:hypothetical protein
MIAIDLKPALPKRVLLALSSLQLGILFCLLLIKPLIVPLWLLLAGLQLQRFRLQQQKILHIKRSPEGQWKLLQASHPWSKVRLLADSLMWQQLIILHFRQERGRHCRVVLDQSSLSVEQWRRLRVSLKLKPDTPDSNAVTQKSLFGR